MSGWDQARRVTLAEPWADFWVDVNPDLEMGAWLDFKEAWQKAKSSPIVQNIEALIAAFGALIIRHNLVDREGEPLPFELRRLTPKLVAAIGEAIFTAQEGAGEAVDPFGNLVPSPALSLVAPTSRRGSRSSSSRGATPTATSRSSARRAG